MVMLNPQFRHIIVGISAVLGCGSAWADTDDEADSDDTVVVTASRTDSLRKDSVVTTLVIDREAIERSGASTVADLFRAQPGVSTERSFAGTSVRLQGLNPEHVLILIDGQRVVGRKNGAIDMSRYPVDWIERVEIVKGPSSVLYGADAMGGVINLITRRADGPFSADVYTSYGTPENLDASGSVAVQRDHVGTRAHGGFHSTSGYDLDPSTLTTDGPARSMFHVGSVSEISLSSDWTLTPRVAYRQQDSSGISESDSGAVFDERNLSEEIQAALGSDTWFSSESRLRLTVFTTWYRDQFDRDQRKSEALDSYNDTRELLIQGSAQYDHIFGEQHLATAGVDVLSEAMESDRLASGSGDRKRIGVFLQDQWTVPGKKRLMILPGARIDFDSQFGIHPTPRIALRYDPHPNWALRGGFGWGYRAPSFKELLMRFENPSAGYVVEGNTKLRPETSRNVNLGVDWSATQKIALSLSGFRNDVRDLIDFGTEPTEATNSTALFSYINVAEAVTQGGEASVYADLWSGFTLTTGYALLDTLNVQENRPLEGRSVHQITSEWYQYIEPTGTALSAKGSWNSPKTFFIDTDGDEKEERLKSQSSTLLDARLSQDIDFRHAGFRLFVGVENILDTGDPDYLPIPPRTIYFGLMGRTPNPTTNPSR